MENERQTVHPGILVREVLSVDEDLVALGVGPHVYPRFQVVGESGVVAEIQPPEVIVVAHLELGREVPLRTYRCIAHQFALVHLGVEASTKKIRVAVPSATMSERVREDQPFPVVSFPSELEVRGVGLDREPVAKPPCMPEGEVLLAVLPAPDGRLSRPQVETGAFFAEGHVVDIHDVSRVYQPLFLEDSPGDEVQASRDGQLGSGHRGHGQHAWR